MTTARSLVPVTAEFYERDVSSRTPLLVPGVEFRVVRYGKSAIGGPLDAEIEAYGSEEALKRLSHMLRVPVELYAHSELVWHGFVNEVELRLSTETRGVSLDTMYNKVAVAYTTPGTAAAPAGERKTTAYASDADSTGTYGTKELLLTMSKATQTAAQARRDKKLAEHKYPIPVLEHVDAPREDVSATLHCRGWWDTLRWRRYSLAEGLVSYEDTDNFDQLWYHSIGQSSYTASTIKFVDSPSADIVEDSAGGMNFTTRQIIVTSGASLPDNNGTWPIESARKGGGQFVVRDPDYDFDTEDEGTSITIRPYGDKVAQSFQHSFGSSVFLSKVRVSCRKVNSPGDTLQCALHTDNAGEPAGSATETATISPSDLGESFALAEFDFGDTTELSASTTYWIVISRTGSNHASNTYQAEINDAAGYANGDFLVFDSSSWGSWTTTHAANADMIFTVEGSRQTTTQVSDIISTHGEFLDSTFVDDASGVYTNPQRDGDFPAIQEIEEMLESGDSNNVRLLADVHRVGSNRVARVYLEPTAGNEDWLLQRNGTLHDTYNSPVPPYRCPVAMWVRKVGERGNLGTGTTQLADPTRAFVERAEYNVDDGTLTLEPRGLPSPWLVGEIQEA